MKPLLLLLVSLSATAADLELSPPSDDWETTQPDHANVKAYLRTEFAGPEPKAVAEVRVMTYALSAALAEKKLDAIARDWAAEIERPFPEPRTVKEGASTLGGEEAWSRDVRTDAARLSWHVARAGDVLVVFHVIRTGKAMDDATVEEEIVAMRAAIELPTKRKEEAPGNPAPPPEPPPTPEETLKFDHWRFECKKPAGLASVHPDKFDAAEKASGVVAKFERLDGQARIMVRLYAQASASQKFTIEQLLEQKLKRFLETYDEASRKPPKRDDKAKFPMAQRAIELELVGRRRTTEVTRWVLAQCRNDRQYQIEIYVAGGDPDRWSKEIREVLDGFRPQKG